MTRSVRALLAAIGFVFVLSAAPQSQAASSFRNQGMIVNTGWTGLGTTMAWANAPLQNPWGGSDAFNLGAGYFHAFGYNLWMDYTATLGFLTASAANQAQPQTVVSLNASYGMRYNFMTRNFRPYVGGNLDYLQFFNFEGTSIKGNQALGNQALWVGLRPKAGFEYIFLDEMGLTFDVGPIVYFNLDNPPVKFSYTARLGLQIYF